MEESTLREIGIVIGTALTVYAPKIVESIKKKIKRITFDKKNIVNTEINNELLSIRILTDSDGAGLIFFKNSEYSMSGFPLDKAHMSHEITAPRVSGVINEFQGISTAPLATMLNSITGRYRVININSESIGPFSKTMAINNISTCVVIKIFSETKSGIIFLHWMNDVKVSESTIENILENVDKISVMIEKIRR